MNQNEKKRKLLESIISITDKSNNNVITYPEIKSISIHYDINTNINHLVLNDKMIHRKNKFQVNYNCVECGRNNDISLNTLMSKIDRHKWNCSTCMNLLVDLNSCTGLFDTALNKTDVQLKIINDKNDFNAMDVDFRQKYFDKFMMEQTFSRIKLNVIGFQNDKYTDINSIQYVDVYRNNPSYKCYEPMIYITTNDTIQYPINVTVFCSLCGYKYKTKNLNSFRNKETICCKMCETEIHNKNKKEQDLFYKTKLQQKFIKYCKSSDICIKNGPRITYNFNGLKTWNIHFELPQNNMYIEVVGNLEKQYEDSERTKYIKSYANENNYTYVQIYPKNFVKVTKTLKKIM